ncbi:helix-turn-helix domain-containing protein [Actinomyces timonensis]|uniref:helix-turn-helix domain-containing protein n=1 Tax=Actinomyces timonensis TaxID=1288391 RepID=UPI0004753845|nr:helix-turn-helix domain-containing protein [Actinomyces timonensis]
MPRRFLTIADVADQLQLSAQGVRALIQSGDLPAIQVGARHLWRIEEAALDEYIDRQLSATREMIASGRLSGES